MEAREVEVGGGLMNNSQLKTTWKKSPSSLRAKEHSGLSVVGPCCYLGCPLTAREVRSRIIMKGFLLAHLPSSSPSDLDLRSSAFSDLTELQL